ncbi:MAG TPA: type II toxin-antitoxin system ParD family antitoxin [Saprospiraceae bacterium]|nr:type II toxin-antitoxin system ParD family antitoxin [Saprospiraceae bacterium]HMU03506.1 type II toxin-antitoxin system ParD family antitoxin [Saprospiraceae bacterium]
MSKNTSVALGTHFEEFAKNRIEEGRYKNISEVIRAGLRLLEDEEQKYVTLRNAIKEGIDSGVDTNFDPKQHLKLLKKNRTENV